MKEYVGTRDGSGSRWDLKLANVKVRDENGVRDLEPRLDLYNHSPTGFNWGYNGSGPAQLALAILADCTGDDRFAQRYYQDYKFDVIGRFDQEHGFVLTEDQVKQWTGKKMWIAKAESVEESA